MGGAIVTQACLTETERIKHLSISGWVFENPFLDGHPDTKTWYSVMIVNMLGCCAPRLHLPQEMDHSYGMV